MQTVAETAYYAQRAAKLLSGAERDAVIKTVAADPLAGDLIQGTGGLRKLRFGKGGRGKSGGVRVIYYYYDEAMPIFMVDIFGKNEKSDLSQAERNSLAKLVAVMKGNRRRVS
ncbi:MAG: type II toxin-antitoxin system RelE/ParE family toxin [Alphaproteobacteria bacterium]